jgi:hypothetical protein
VIHIIKNEININEIKSEKRENKKIENRKRENKKIEHDKKIRNNDKIILKSQISDEFLEVRENIL